MIDRMLGKMEDSRSEKLDSMEAESSTKQTIRQSRRSNTISKEDNLRATQ